MSHRTLITPDHPGVRRLAAAVIAGEIGLPWAVQADQVCRGGSAATPSSLFTDAVAAVRAVLGLAVHSVAARGTGWDEADDHGVLTATVIFEHGVAASITVSRIAAPGLDEARLRVMGNEGVLVADLARPAVLLDGGAALRSYGPEP
ncbi:MAG TPA: hypothetical protein VK020_01150, partial [Microlunatus sp.]|nr:hypothetical protein [Microlunatus sp.]